MIKDMLDINFIRENKEIIQEAVRKKHCMFVVDELIKADDRRRECVSEIEALKKSEHNNPETIAALAKKTEEFRALMKEWQTLMIAVPNIPDMSVPEGEDAKSNREEAVVGMIPKFSFTPKPASELVKNARAEYVFALFKFVSDKAVSQGFGVRMAAPFVSRQSLVGAGYIPENENVCVKIQDNLYLPTSAGTSTFSEYADRVFEEADVPKKFASFSPVFKKTADGTGVVSSYCMDYVVFAPAHHMTSVTLHEEIRAHLEDILRTLDIPHRVVTHCGGELRLGESKAYGFELWSPVAKEYKKTYVLSYAHDFYSRRFNIRYKDAGGKIRFVHTLSGTILDTDVLLAALIENRQKEDGSVDIPIIFQNPNSQPF